MQIPQGINGMILHNKVTTPSQLGLNACLASGTSAGARLAFQGWPALESGWRLLTADVDDEETCEHVLKPFIHLAYKVSRVYAVGTRPDGDQLVLS